jgi:hypothetical protein
MNLWDRKWIFHEGFWKTGYNAYYSVLDMKCPYCGESLHGCSPLAKTMKEKVTMSTICETYQHTNCGFYYKIYLQDYDL